MRVPVNQEKTLLQYCTFSPDSMFGTPDVFYTVPDIPLPFSHSAQLLSNGLFQPDNMQSFQQRRYFFLCKASLPGH